MAKVSAIPAGMHSVTANLVCEGAADAIAFYKRAFGAEELMRALDPSGKKVWHAELRIGDSILFINDPVLEMGQPPMAIKLWIYGEGVDAAYKRAVDAGGKSALAPTDMFWGDRMAQINDRWGNIWMLTQHVRDMTPEEMQKAQDDFVASLNPKK
jgi:PhnB protein